MRSSVRESNAQQRVIFKFRERFSYKFRPLACIFTSFIYFIFASIGLFLHFHFSSFFSLRALFLSFCGCGSYVSDRGVRIGVVCCFTGLVNLYAAGIGKSNCHGKCEMMQGSGAHAMPGEVFRPATLMLE